MVAEVQRSEVLWPGRGKWEERWGGEKVEVEEVRKRGGVEDARYCGGCMRVRWGRYG